MRLSGATKCFVILSGRSPGATIEPLMTRRATREMFPRSVLSFAAACPLGPLAEGLQMAISRRQFCEGLMIGGSFAGTPALGGPHAPSWPQSAATRTGSDLGSLYPFVQAQADRSRFDLSLLHPEFSNLRQWQATVRARIFEHLYYAPPRVPPQPQVIRRPTRATTSRNS